MTSAAAPASLALRAECEVDLTAIRGNVEQLRSRLASGTQLWAVIKADAYGHGVDRVAEAAILGGASRVCVATLSEARHLRQVVGVRSPMLVMGPLDAAAMRRAADLDVAVTVLSSTMLESLANVGSSASRPLRVHLKVDTGMGRWGLPIDDSTSAIDSILAQPGIELEGIMTHFATADDLEDPFFDLQLERFRGVVEHAKGRAPGVIAHAANSAATVRGDAAHFDAVRCGVAIYGLSPTQGDPNEYELQPAMSLRSVVADIRPRDAGESVGYCRTFVAGAPSLVALVPLGYADGLRRLLSNSGAAIVNGTRYPLVGNISMDHCSLLVDESVRVGDTVTLLGADGDARVTAEDHAAWAQTINYEITCGIAVEPRLRRTWHAR
jgi:alanine racemase